MDPLTVLGLVSNIVQLVDASSRAAQACYQIYKHGASLEDLRVVETANHLQRCYDKLSHPPRVGPSPPGLQSGVDLTALSEKCAQCAQILCHELAALRPSPGGGRREAMAKFFQTKRKAKMIEDLKKRLDEYQKVLDTLVLVDLRDNIKSLAAQQSDSSSNVEQRLSVLAAGLTSCETAASSNLRTLINNAIADSHREHETTRQQIQGHISDAVETLTLTQTQKEMLQKDKDRFRESLRFDEINLRKNEIIESYPDTFGWIFQEDQTSKWSCFISWLQHGQKIYWINGKAGSGKSTLMKFIVNHDRTADALNLWSGDTDCMTIAFYFWLSGSKMQRNMKGFLCSLLYQLLDDDLLLEEILRGNSRLAKQQRRVEDWSMSDLKSVLGEAIGLATKDRKLCIFVDGVDEFDQEEEVAALLDHMQHLGASSRIKFCVSSRTEIYLEKRLSRYPKLRLQDLTRSDMRACVEQELSAVHQLHSRAITEGKELEDFVDMMIRKADGVFLWVHFALKSVLRGIKNDDDFDLLQGRLEDLPSGMEKLYKNMWQRLNGDEIRYQREASELFSYHEHFPLSIFELMVALRIDLQERYLSHVTGLDSLEMVQACQKFMTRVRTRSAGLLQFSVDEAKLRSYRDYPSRRFSISLDQHETYEEESSPLEQIPYLGPRLEWFQAARISLIHRTARDFLLNTKAGRTIASEPLDSFHDRRVNVVKARMASLIQGLQKVAYWTVFDIVSEIGRCSTTKDAELMGKLKQVCDSVSLAPNTRSVDLQYGYHFDCMTVAVGLQRWNLLQSFLDNEKESVSSYYRGYLFTCIVDPMSRRGSSDRLTGIKMARWVARRGPDLWTKGWSYDFGRRPIEELLESCFSIFWAHMNSEEEPKDAPLSKEKQTQLALLVDECIALCLDHDALIVRLNWHRHILKELRGTTLWVEMSPHWVYCSMFRVLAWLGVEPGNLRPTTPHLNGSTKIVAYRTEYNSPYGLPEGLWQPTPEDARYLGQALEQSIWCHDPNKARQWPHENFISKLEEIKPRCKVVDQESLEIMMGRKSPANISSPTLNPAEGSDEWNKILALESPRSMSELRYGMLPRPRSQLHYRRKSMHDRGEYLGFRFPL